METIGATGAGGHDALALLFARRGVELAKPRHAPVQTHQRRQTRGSHAWPGSILRRAYLAPVPGVWPLAGAAIIAARQQRAWTQAELARRFGVSATLMCFIERGQMSANETTARHLASVLELEEGAWARLLLRPDSGGRDVGAR